MKKISARDEGSKESSEQKARTIVIEAKEQLKDLERLLDMINEKVNDPSVMDEHIILADHMLDMSYNEMISHGKEVVSEIKKLGIPKEHEIVQDFASTITNLSKRIKAISDKIIEVSSIPEAEGRDLKSVEVKSLTMEEIHDKILDLYEELKKAISQKEKEIIQAKIQELHRML